MDDDTKMMKIQGVVPDDHEALSAYARLFGIPMQAAFGRAVAALTASLDDLQRASFEKLKAGQVAGYRRKGRKAVAKENAP